MKLSLIFFILLTQSFILKANDRLFPTQSMLNDDGSVSLIAPKFKSSRNQISFYIAKDSSTDGVCKLYDLGSYINNSLTYYRPSSYTNYVKLDFQGQFNGYIYSEETFAIHSISCKPKYGMPYPHTVSKNYKDKVINNDMSVSIILPKFKIANANYSLSTKSDLNGICRLFGFRFYVSNSILKFTPNQYERLVNINHEGTFRNYEKLSMDGVFSLICRL